MNFTINTEILKKYNLSLGEFLVMLLGYFELDYSENVTSLIDKTDSNKNLYNDSVILSNNTKKLISQILVESDRRVINSTIDFNSLADTLRNLYPVGNKPGTSYPWQGTTEEIALQLKSLIAMFDFEFTEEEAVSAVQEYLATFEEPNKFTKLLKNFIFTIKANTINSPFMTIIENNRQ